ncbi:hypothetical protein HN51_004801 [Arachis hypogaea]
MLGNIPGTRLTLRWIEEEEESMKDNSVFQFVILEMSAVSNIDTSGVSLFQELKSALETKDIKLALVNPLAEVIEKLTKADESDSFIREEYLFLSVGEAVRKLSSIMENPPSVTMQQEQPPYMSPPTELPVESPEYSNNV